MEADNSDTDGLHSVDLTWDPVDSKLVRGYNIYIKDGDEYRQINTELVKDTKYTVSDLDTNTNYIFVVAHRSLHRCDRTGHEYHSQQCIV
ncbi:MAG: fibronectin type III domain-containing protein [Anaerovoracaceae bacterium]